jgi:addiction module RelE/StbE family toxin
MIFSSILELGLQKHRTNENNQNHKKLQERCTTSRETMKKNGEASTDEIDICSYGDAKPQAHPHFLIGDWLGYRECHIEPDWLLIYSTSEDVATFYRTGTH